MGKRIKILFTIPNFDTAGSGKVVYDLVKGLDKKRFEPHICCTHTKGEFFKKIKELEVPIHIFSFYVSYRPFINLPISIWRIAQFFRKHRFDIIHSWHWSSDITEPIAAKLAGIPYIYTKKAMGWGNRSWTWRSQLSSHIIAINKDMMTDFFGNMKDKTTLMPLGVDTEVFKPENDSIDVPTDIPVNKSDFIITTVANLVPVKNIELLIKAFLMLNQSKIKLFIIGNYDNSYGKNLKSEFENQRIVFLGKRTDVRSYLNVSDIFVIPSIKEGLPIAPLEAMACGKIVLGSDIPGVREILEDFPKLLFESGNVLTLKEKIEWLITLSDEERKDLSRKMRKKVLQDFNLSRFILNHESLYNNLI